MSYTVFKQKIQACNPPNFNVSIQPSANIIEFTISDNVDILIPTKVRMYDIGGRLIRKEEILPTDPLRLELDYQYLAAGVYILSVEINGVLNIQKIAITHI